MQTDSSVARTTPPMTHMISLIQILFLYSVSNLAVALSLHSDLQTEIERFD